MRISAGDLYPAGEAQNILGLNTEPSASNASGDILDDENQKNSPVIAFVALIALLFGVRLLWESAK